MATVINTVFPASLPDSLHEFVNDCKEYLNQWEKSYLNTYKKNKSKEMPLDNLHFKGLPCVLINIL